MVERFYLTPSPSPEKQEKGEIGVILTTSFVSFLAEGPG